jgi:hypothetical protein
MLVQHYPDPIAAQSIVSSLYHKIARRLRLTHLSNVGMKSQQANTALQALNPMPAVVYASSSSVYGLNTKQPFSETDPVEKPASLYASTKRVRARGQDRREKALGGSCGKVLGCSRAMLGWEAQHASALDAAHDRDAPHA